MRSESLKKAQQKYDKTHYKSIVSKVKIQDVEIYQKKAAKYCITMSKFIARCLNYCVNNNIDLSNDIKLDIDTDDK